MVPPDQVTSPLLVNPVVPEASTDPAKVNTPGAKSNTSGADATNDPDQVTVSVSVSGPSVENVPDTSAASPTIVSTAPSPTTNVVAVDASKSSIRNLPTNTSTAPALEKSTLDAMVVVQLLQVEAPDFLSVPVIVLV